MTARNISVIYHSSDCRIYSIQFTTVQLLTYVVQTLFIRTVVYPEHKVQFVNSCINTLNTKITNTV